MRRNVHVHLHRRTQDAAAPTGMAGLYRDLVNRMWAAAQELRGRTGDARSRTLDDEEGHKFHGNQWVKVAGGPKPDTATLKAAHGSKTGKEAMYDLLCTGHAFTKEELMEVCGLQPKKLTDYLAMLKNPKYAGPKGALQIEKNQDGHYFVAAGNGQIAPALPKAEVKELKTLEQQVDEWLADPTKDPLASIKEMQEHNAKAAATPPMPASPADLKAGLQAIQEQIEQKAMKAAKASPHAALAAAMAPAPEASPAPPVPVVTSVYGAQHASQLPLDALMNAHPGSMTKGEADKKYEAIMTAANMSLFHMVKFPGHDTENGPIQAVLKWKQAKAQGMAAWATAVHGSNYTPKTQQIYKADEKLVEDIKAGQPTQAAIEQWKKNTAAEKYGFFPPKDPEHAAAAPVGGIPTHAVPEVADMGHASPVAKVAYESLVPEGSKGIGEEDITGHKFSTGIAAFKKDLLADAGNAIENKKSIEHKLRERLKDKPNFQAMLKRLKMAKEGVGSLEARLIQQWAHSSGDHHDVSVALQIAVKDAFGIPDKDIEKAALGSLKQYGGDEDKLVASAFKSLGPNTHALAPHEIPTAKAALQEFVLAQYEETQDQLKKMGRDHVYLARGMTVKVSDDAASGPAALKLQPASSFSTAYSTAKAFSGSHGTVFLVKVPREQVLSSYRSGFGCTGENEVVVLAHGHLKAYAVPSGAAGTSPDAQAHVLSKMGKGGPAPGSIEEHTANILKKYPAVKPAAKKKAAGVLATHFQPVAGHNPTSAAFVAAATGANAPLTHAEATAHYAAAKKAAINAKSKAYKAHNAAKANPTPAKWAHAEQALEEAHAAVKMAAEAKLKLKGAK